MLSYPYTSNDCSCNTSANVNPILPSCGNLGTPCFDTPGMRVITQNVYIIKLSLFLNILMF